MLDINIATYVLKNRPEHLRRKFNENAGRLALSAVALSELAYGAEKSSRVAANLEILDGFIARLEVLPFDEAAAYHAGQIRADLQEAGPPIGAYDVMIAGHARSAGLTVVTNNRREFERVPGLQLADWSPGTS
ncbi:type II toxin-antitoxin system tRNA(fMet)-specific endonuclease VapC [Crystallibacter crystallopoietes]|nr:tRNA(fMet)-specific endonuclease VapC [Arthrobacter crystallopoietes]